MEKEQKAPPPYTPPYYEEDEIDLYELWLTLKKYKRLIWGLTFTVTFLVAFFSLFMTNIYRSKAVILPVGEKSSPLLSQFGGLAQMAGISLPSSGSSNEIIALLKSDILKKEVIERYNLLPVLLYNSWDPEKKQWKKPSGIGYELGKLKQALIANFQKHKQAPKNSEYPDIDDGLEVFRNILNVSEDKKLGTITVSIDYPDPEVAAKLVKYVLTTLRQHMTEEAIRIAQKNKKILEQELIKTSDPTIQQKLYNLIAQQVETITMARVNENFAFKIIDPPRVPDKKYKPKRALIVAVAFVSTLFLSIFLAFFLEYLKNVRQRNQSQETDDVSD